MNKTKTMRHGMVGLLDGWMIANPSRAHFRPSIHQSINPSIQF
jgi:hypothetical protein